VKARNLREILHRIERAGAPPRCISVQCAGTGGPVAQKPSKTALACSLLCSNGRRRRWKV